MAEQNTILFTLVYQQRQVVVRTRLGQYPSLMSLIADYLSPPGFGLCSGMGGCGTCVISINGIPHLACGLAISEDLANTHIVLNESYW